MSKTKLKQFLYDLIDAENDRSSKRFITLVAMFHFIIGSFLILGLFTFVAISPTKGDIEFLKIMNDILKVILEYDLLIIMGGLGFITAENLGRILTKKFTKGYDNGGGWGWGGHDHENTDDFKKEQNIGSQKTPAEEDGKL